VSQPDNENATVSESEDVYGEEDGDLIDETEEESDESVDVNTDAVKRPTGKRRKKKVTSRKLW
jgi:hypothetical protein